MKEISFRNDVLPLKNKLFRLALRITLNREEAEDVVQDTLMKVWNSRDKWQQLESIEAYSLTIARNLSLDRIKKMDNNNGSLDEEQVERQDQASTPSERMIQKDKLDIVRKIIDELPEKQRSCLQLRDIEGKAYKEIADILSITEEQVKVNIFRARQTVKQRFQQFDRYGLSEAKNEALGEEFDQKMMSLIEDEYSKEPNKAKVVSLTERLKPLFKAAAVVAIFLTLGNAAQVPFQDDSANIENVGAIKTTRGASVALGGDSATVDSMQHSSIDKMTTEPATTILK